MRFVPVFRFIICVCCASLPACANPDKALFDTYSEAEVTRFLATKEYAFLERATPEEARRTALKRPEAPLFFAFHLMEAGETALSGIFLESAAGVTRSARGTLQTDKTMQAKIPHLIRITSVFELCALLERESRAFRPFQTTRNPAVPDATSAAAIRSDALFLKRVLEGGDTSFALPQGISPAVFPRFQEAIQDLDDAILRTETAGTTPAPEDIDGAIQKLRALVLDRFYGEAADVFFSLMERGIPAQRQLLSSRDILSACGRALLYSETAPETAVAALEQLRRLASRNETGGGPREPRSESAPEAEYMLAFYLARIHAKIPGNAARSAELMEYSCSIAPSASDRDASLWHMFDMARSSGDGALLDILEARLKEWSDPRFFTDILSPLTTSLTEAKDTDALERLENLLPPDTPPAEKERVAYIRALYMPEGSPRREEKLESLRRNAVTAYYKIKSAEALGVPPELAPPYTTTELAGRKTAPLSTEEETAREVFASQAGDLIASCLRWKFTERAAYFAESFPFADFKTVEKTARELSQAGAHPDAIRLLLTALNRNDPETISPRSLRRTAELLYPQPWKETVTHAAREFSGNAAGAPTSSDAQRTLAPTLIFALIRQESLFNPNAVSSAGAAGLMQLMEATATENARKLKLESFDVFSPEDNIRLGTFYLSEMLRRLDGELVPALCAYNAGITRVRRWQAAFGYRDFPAELFLEAVPFNETRNYVKNIVSFMHFYSKIYTE